MAPHSVASATALPVSDAASTTEAVSSTAVIAAPRAAKITARSAAAMLSLRMSST
ncbi:hypothetical protein D9M68_996900 [compost metagenome]